MSKNVVGVIVSKLDAIVLAEITGDIPQNVNFAIKGQYALALLYRSGIGPEEHPSNRVVDGPAIARKAKEFTTLITCKNIS